MTTSNEWKVRISELEDAAGKVAVPVELKQPLDALILSEAAVQRIDLLRHQATLDQETANRDYDKAVAALGEAEAEAALNGKPVPKTLMDVAQNHQAMRLRFDALMSGLNLRRDKAVQDLENAAAVVREAHRDWKAKTIDANQAEIAAKINEFVASIAPLIGVGLGLGDPRLIYLVKHAAISSPADPGRNALDTLRFYKSNAEIMSAADAYWAICQLVTVSVQNAMQISHSPVATS